MGKVCLTKPALVLNRQNHIPFFVPCLNIPVGFSCLFKWEALINHRLKLPLFKKFPDKYKVLLFGSCKRTNDLFPPLTDVLII